MSQKIKTSVEIDGSLKASQIANATTDTDKFLVSDSGTVKYRTGAEVLSDLGITVNTASKLQHQVKAGVAINKGQAVYVTSADGTNMIVGLASNASEATSSKTMGLLDGTVAINGFANVVTEGLLSGLSITGAVSEGDPVWLGTGGNLIYGLANKPSAPNHLVFIGIVTRVNDNNGEIFVKVQNGFELNEIHDVDLKTTLPSGNDILAFEGAPVNLWKNKTIASVLGYTPYNASNPAGYISTYTETDTLASVTARGASTSILSTFDGGLNIGNAKLRWGGSTTPTLGLPFSGSTNAFWIDVNDGDTGGLMVDNEGVTVYGAGDNGYVFRVIDEDVYQSTLNVGSSTTFQITQGQNGGGFIKGNFDISGYTTIGGSAYLASGNSLFFDSGVTNDYSIRKNGTALQFDSAGDFTFNKGVNILTTRDNALVLRAMDGGTNPWNYIEYVNSAGTRKYYVGTDTSNVFNIWSDDGTGYVASNTSFRAPIFYDSNNTSYYGDFGSTSNSLYLAGQIYTTKATGTLISVNGADTIGYNSTTGGAYLKGTGNSYIYGGGLYFDGSVNQTLIHTGNIGSYAVPASRTITINGTSYDLSANRSWTVTANETDTLATVTARGNTTTGDVNINGKIRVGSFPNSTVNNGEAWIGRAADRSAGTMTVQLGGNLDRKFEVVDYGWTTVNFSVNGYGAAEASGSMRAPIFYDSNNTGYYTDPASTSYVNAVDARSYITSGNPWGTGNSAWFPNGITTPNATSWLYGTVYLGNAPGNGAGTEATSSGHIISTGDHRASIFYDYNNTGYYLDPSSTGTSLNVRGIISNPSVWINNGDAVNGYNENIRLFNASNGVSVIAFGASGTSGMPQSSILGFSDRYEVRVGAGGDWQQRSYAGYTEINGSSRAPLFYDSNNTGYYLDPASTTRVNAVVADNLYSINNIYLESNYGSSVIGLYSSSRYQGVYSMGSAYKLAIDGTTTGNLYGLAWAHPNAGGVAGNLNTHGLLALENGTWLASLTGSTRARDDMRAPIFYDNNNTSYYVDPSGGSYCNSFSSNQFYALGWFRNSSANTGIYNEVNGNHIYSSGGSAWSITGNGGNIELQFRSNNGTAIRGYVYADTSNNIGFLTSGGGWRFRCDDSGNAIATGDVTAYSDRRVKENIHTIDNALDKVNNLRGVYYTRIDSEDKQRKVGVIAQETLEVLPEVVGKDTDGMYNVAYGNITAVLIEAIKEQQSQIEGLKKLVNKLIEK